MKMSDATGFADVISHEEGSTELAIAVKVAWFLSETVPDEEVTLASVCDFIEGYGIRANVNRSRLMRGLSKSKDISAPKGRALRVSSQVRKLFKGKYAIHLDEPQQPTEDNVLHLADFASARPYVLAIATQVNRAYQYECFDACGVMMRRLVEVLIIDAYEAKGERTKIVDQSGNYLMMKGLSAAIQSGNPFKLSRNAPKCLEKTKEIGDNAAHSRTYITKRMDIEGFAPAFRRLVSELSHLT